MNKKITIFLIIIMTLSLLGAVSATTPAKDHTNSATCYSCNDSSQCYCNDSCLCKDKNYIQRIGGENKIRNNDSCYRCNETCYCPDNCSCKQPYSEDDIEASKEYMNYRNDFFVKTFKSTPAIYVVNYIYIHTHHLKHKDKVIPTLPWPPFWVTPPWVFPNDTNINISAEPNSTTTNTTITNNTTIQNNTQNNTTNNGNTTNLENQTVTTDNNSNDGSNVKDNSGDTKGSGSNGESSGSDNSGGSDSSSSDPGSSSTESSEN